MGESALAVIQKQVEEQGKLPVDLNIGYQVLFSSMTGSLPINHRVTGELAGLPVDLQLGYTMIKDPSGGFPVNTSLRGRIGDTVVQAKLNYQVVFSSIAGNIPVNTGVEWEMDGEKICLTMPTAYVSAFARAGGMQSAGGAKTGLKMEVKYKQGVMVEVEGGGGGGAPSEAGRPIPQGVQGCIGDLLVDCRFSYTYFINCSSGRNPINTRLKGVIRKR
ncbi:MAG: hypothetical protein RBU29_10645 [bacterium]|jgi:hypothetical protein|nr:hypothetical protein [bacterium]